MQNSIQKSVNTILIQESTTTSNNFNKIIETGPSERALAQNLFNSHAYDELKILFIERIVELGYDSAYQTLLTIRRLNQLFSGIIDQYLTGRLNIMYQPNDFPLGKFQILEHNNFFELPPCLRPNRLLVAEVFNDSKPQISYSINNNLFKFNFDIHSTLQQSLILYFHAKRQFIKDPDNLACKSFAEIFESHLKSFRSLCQNSKFHFYIPNDVKSLKWQNLIDEWLIVPIDNAVKNNILLHLNSPYSAYLFAHFLQACVSNQWIFPILQLPWGKHEVGILLFFEKYRFYSLVSSILNNFINACNQGLSYNKLQIQHNSLCYLLKFAQHGWLNEAFVKNCNLFQKTLNFVSHNEKIIQCTALNLIYALIEKDLIDKSLIEELKLQDIVNKIFFNTTANSLPIEGHAALLFLLLINKGFIDDSLMIQYDVMRKIVLAYKYLQQPCEKLASLKEIKEQIKHAIDLYLTKAMIPNLGLNELCSKTGLLFKLAKNSLIEKSIIKLIEEQKIDALSPSTEKEIYQLALNFLKILLVSNSLITHQLRF